MCTQRGFSSCDGILKYKLKVGLFIGCAKTLNEATLYIVIIERQMHIWMDTVRFKCNPF